VSAPQLRIEPLGAAKRDGDGWRTTWRVTNVDTDPARIVGAAAPHSQFRGESVLDREVRGKGSTQISLVVRIEGVAGREIANAFVILLVQRGEERWRILTRLRITLDHEDTPHPRVEAVTVQRVGFSGEL
jgi:hypothetical protein